MDSQTTTAAGLSARVREHARGLGFDLFGITAIRPSDHAQFYRAWLAAGRHGSMSYLSRADAVERRLHPDAAYPDLRSAIVLGMSYYVADHDANDASHGIIARYARGRDYHKVISRKVIALLRAIENEVGHALPLARASVDTAPVLERELAQRAGLGWFGRSAMLINPMRGSYFFLATLLVELEFDEYDAPFERDHCGTCSACVTACPTGALLGRDENGAPVIDATRCISYQTIENRGPIPRELRPLMGNRIFGCDICQEVCPWNGPKFVQIAREPAFSARGPGEPPVGVQLEPGASMSHPGTAAPPLIALLETALDEAAWDSFSKGSPLRRAGRAAFARNVCVALGNQGSPQSVPALSAALSDPAPLVRAHAAWALGEVGSPEAVAALEASLPAERESFVMAEVETVLDRYGRGSRASSPFRADGRAAQEAAR